MKVIVARHPSVLSASPNFAPPARQNLVFLQPTESFSRCFLASVELPVTVQEEAGVHNNHPAEPMKSSFYP